MKVNYKDPKNNPYHEEALEASVLGNFYCR